MKIENKIITYESLSDLIYFIHNQKVMLDYDLAKIYGYTTKRFNERIKDNLQRFDDDFRFKLTNDEWKKILRSEIPTSSWGGRRAAPFAFTEQGIYMLMTVLKGDLAIKQSKALIRMFKYMKDYVLENGELLGSSNLLTIARKVDSNSKRLDCLEGKICEVVNSFTKEENCKHFLILKGEKIEADIAYQKIYAFAKYSIYIIDDYIDIKTLQLLKCCSPNIEIIIFTDNKSRNNITKGFLKDFVDDTSCNISLKYNGNLFHDRYIVIDFDTNTELIYHCGASSKDAGKRITTISKIDDINLYKNSINKLLMNDYVKLK